MHLSNKEACETIDAAFFSGDAFHNEKRLQEIIFYLKRWEKEIKRIIKNNYYKYEE